MDYQLEDTSSELINSEQLHAFSVVELYCQGCDKHTAHQIDDDDIENHICVNCRRDEEARLEL